MLRKLWNTFSSITRLEQVIEKPTLGLSTAEVGLEAWQSLNELAETTWRFFRDDEFPQGRGRLSLDNLEFDLLQCHQRLATAIGAIQTDDLDQARHMLSNSGETLRQFGAVCQILMDARSRKVDLSQLSSQELAAYAEKYLPTKDIDILLRPRPPTPIALEVIEGQKRSNEWHAMHHT